MRPPQRGCLRENTRDMTSVLCWCSTTASSDTSVGYIATPNTASPPVGYHHVASTNRPPGRSRLATRANRSALPAASRWCTSSADTTRSSCPRQWVLETVHPRIGGGDLYGSSVGGPRFGQGLITGSQHESPDGHGPSYRSIEPTAVEPTSATPRDGLHPSRAVARLPSDTIGPAC
jgi:hypothetical protein